MKPLLSALIALILFYPISIFAKDVPPIEKKSIEASAAPQLAPIPCPFNTNKPCTLQRDILNDIASDGEKYHASTNYDHRQSSEINVYRTFNVGPYTDATNAPGQLKMSGQPTGGDPAWFTGEIMTRHDLWKNPWNSGTHSHPWTTKESTHGYLEVVVKNAKCEKSDDNGCDRMDHNLGLWPAIWMEPTYDSNWPQNGEIDLMEAYESHTDTTRSDVTIHFFGNDPRCPYNDCVHHGYHVAYDYTTEPQWAKFHTWGFEWQPDPQSNEGGMILTGYFDNKLSWGPLRTDTLPSDGPKAMQRGFNDPNGGFYLIVNLAVGGLMTGKPNPHVQAAGMYLQSAKAYSVGEGPPPPPQGTCNPPANVQSMWTPDKKQITIAWQKPTTTSPVQTYEVHDWQDKLIWKSSSEAQHCYMDSSLPGTNGTFTYYLYTNCQSGPSQKLKVDVVIK